MKKKPTIFVAGGTRGKKQQLEINWHGEKEHKFFIKINDKRAGVKTLDEVILSKTSGNIVSWTSTKEEKELTYHDNSFFAETNCEGMIKSSLEIPESSEKRIFIRPEIEKGGDLIGNFILAYFTYFSRRYGFEIPKISSIEDITNIEKAVDIARKHIPSDEQAVTLLLGDCSFLRHDELDFLVNGLYGKGDFATYFVNKQVFDAFIEKLGAGNFSNRDYRKHKMNFFGMKSEKDGAGLYRFGNISVINPLRMDAELLEIISFIVSHRHFHDEGHESWYHRVEEKADKVSKIQKLRKKYISRHSESEEKINSVAYNIFNMFYTSLFHYHKLDASLNKRFPSFENFSEDITKALSVAGRNFNVSILPLELQNSPRGKLYGAGILYDLDTRETVDFTRRYVHLWK